MNLTYKTYAWIGLAGVVLSILASVLDQLKMTNVSLPFSILSYVASAIFLWAFVDIADKLKNTALLIGSSALFILELLLILFSIFSLFATLPIDASSLQDPAVLMSLGIGLLVAAAVLFILVGALTITSGIGFLKLKDKFGGLATATGVLDIITGASFVLIILFFIGVFTMLASFILKVIILFKADEQLE